MTPRVYEVDGERFITHRWADHSELVRRVKVCCLAAGGTPEQCQTDVDEPGR